MFDWQTILVALIILAAVYYVGRRAWKRLRGFRPISKAKSSSSSCAVGCGCGDDDGGKSAAAKPRVVKLGRSRY